ncbi:fasciclin domain-containing protein [Novosphingobium clariflavum]|uniref:Fasciclin domain-containing protein n=1 Tax=Novosphingobium clariflavum TaxID=2029884 RepID=A0ABV6SF01_9SPHN|nr:fasciclin domain-containing protein [Novosphingobium clariflavum]
MRKALLAAPVLAAPILAAPVLAAALMLAACSGGSPATGPSSDAAETTAANETLPEMLDDADGQQTMAEALKTTGLERLFAGKGSYTLLAPEDDAFDALGDKAKAVTQAQDHAALTALVRSHMLAGYRTPEDITAAIAAAGTGTVSLPTLGGGTLTFRKTGTPSADSITVTADDGSEASLLGPPVAAGGSIAIPVSGVLRKL